MSGTGSGTASGLGGSDTVDGASFAALVPYAGGGAAATAAYADMVRLGAVDASDEPSLNTNPADPTSQTFKTAGKGSPFGAGALHYTLGSLQFVGPDGYLRIGQAGDYEQWLTTLADSALAPTAPKAGASTTPFGANGLVLHSRNQITNFAPTITNTAKSISTTTDSVVTYSTDSMSAVFTDDSHIGVLSSQTRDSDGVLTNANYSVVDNLSSVIGNSVTTVGGSMATVWAGADASTGIGSLLWSNFGITENLFGGSIVNIINGAVDLQGWGETKLSDFGVVAPSQISLAVAPIADATTWSAKILYLSQRYALLGGAVNGALVMCMEAAIGKSVDNIGESEGASNPDELQKMLDLYKGLMLAVTGLTASLQLASMVAGRALYKMAAAAIDQQAGHITVTNGAIVLSAGGTTVTINGQGFKVDAGNPAASVLAATNMAQVDISVPVVLANQLQFVGAVAGVGTKPNVNVVVPTKTISLSTLGPCQIAATGIQFTLPEG